MRTAIFGNTGSGKSNLIMLQLAAIASRSIGSLRRDIAVLDGQHRLLSQETPRHLVSTLGRLTAVDPEVADHNLESYLQLSTVVHELAHRLLQKLFQDFRDSLLRLINGVRAILRLMLIRVLSALSRRPDRLDFVLILLASCRSYGHRGEPADYALPALTSMSAVIGEAARSR